MPLSRTVAELEMELESLDFDGIEANFRCILSLGSPPLLRYERLLVRLSAALKEFPRSEDLLALKGKALANLSRYDAARDCLELSSRLGPSSERTRAWLASVYLLQGDFRAALRQAVKALSRGSRACSWARFYKAAALYGQGRADSALKEALGARGAGEGASEQALEAFSGMLLAGASRFDEARAALDRVVASSPKSAWPHALRAKALRMEGRARESLAGLDKALELSPEPWIFEERSSLHETLGDIPRALEDVERALAVAGPRAELFLRRAHLQVCRRHYHLAVPDYTRAVKLAPRSPLAYLGRAMVHCIRNRRALALRDMRAAEALSGADAAVTLERLRMQIQIGRLEGVLRELDLVCAARADLRAEAGFLRGCHEIKARAFSSAVAAFDRARALRPGPDPKNAFYRAAAQGLLATEGRGAWPARPGSARLYICGLGIRPPYTASLEVLRAVLDSDFVFNNMSEPEIAVLLCLFSKDYKPTMFDVRGADARWTRTIFREIRPGRTVAFVTRGHPLVCGGLAASLIAECGAKGVDYRVLGSVSSMDTLAASALPGARAHWGSQVLDYSSVFSPDVRLDTRVPAVIYFNATVQTISKSLYTRFCAALEEAYSPSHVFDFYGRSFYAAPETIPIARLRGYYGAIDPSFTLFIPPRPGNSGA